jgi:hypothetical protein
MSGSANSNQSVNHLREDAVCFFFDVKSIKDQLKRLVNTCMMNNASEREEDEKDTLLIITERREKKNVSRQSKSSKSLRRVNEINALLDESLRKIHGI